MDIWIGKRAMLDNYFSLEKFPNIEKPVKCNSEYCP